MIGCRRGCLALLRNMIHGSDMESSDAPVFLHTHTNTYVYYVTSRVTLTHTWGPSAALRCVFSDAPTEHAQCCVIMALTGDQKVNITGSLLFGRVSEDFFFPPQLQTTGIQSCFE